MYVQESLRTARRRELDNRNLEVIWLETQEGANRRALVFYKPPSSDASFMSELIK